MKIQTLGLSTPSTAEKRSIEKRGNPLETLGVGLNNIGAIWSWISGSEPTSSGELIDENTALQIIEVYSCIRIISSTVASFPLKLYSHEGRGRHEELDNNLYDILTVNPNPEMTSVNFWEATVAAMCLHGNAYAYIQRVGGQVEALWPLNARKTKPIRMPDGSLAYQTWDGLSNGSTKIYPKEDILHFRLFSLDGLLGMSPITMARQGLGLARAAERMGSKIFAAGGRPAAIMTPKEGFNPDEKTLMNVRESWQASQSGENATKTAFIPGQWSYNAVSLNMEDIEFLKTRQFQRTEVASLYGIPPHLIGDTTRQSNTNSSQEMLSLVTLTLRPYLNNIETEIQRTLLSKVGRNANKFFVEFDYTELLKGDFKTTQEGFAVGRQWGFYSANTVLEKMGENPIGPVGDVYLVAVNYTNAQNLLNPPTQDQPQPALDPATEPLDTTPTLIAGPSDNERSIVDRASSLMPVFKDSIGRALHREKCDLAHITGIFEPTLRSIVALSVADVNKKMGIDWSDIAAEQHIIEDTLKSMSKRSDDWTAETVGEEFRKVLRQIVANVWREAGAATTKE